MKNEVNAKLYDNLLLEYDKKAREVSIIKSKFDLSKEDERLIDELKREMVAIQRKAETLTHN
jgi:hypothetical protein